jgi:hypothetical protein
MQTRRRILRIGAGVALGMATRGQVIEFESGGLRYQTLTRNGVTIMFAHLALHIREYAVLQVAISNGSSRAWVFKPQEFRFQKGEGPEIQGVEAHKVVDEFMKHGGRDDVIKLVTAYESGLYGMQKVKSTNGYEMRRQSVIADMTNTRWKAAAAASAIVLVPVRLKPGESTDGAVFFSTSGKPLTNGKLSIEGGGSVFEYETGAGVEAKP